jgi:hypothetical protein
MRDTNKGTIYSCLTNFIPSLSRPLCAIRGREVAQTPTSTYLFIVRGQGFKARNHLHLEKDRLARGLFTNALSSAEGSSNQSFLFTRSPVPRSTESTKSNPPGSTVIFKKGVSSRVI